MKIIVFIWLLIYMTLNILSAQEGSYYIYTFPSYYNFYSSNYNDYTTGMVDSGGHIVIPYEKSDIIRVGKAVYLVIDKGDDSSCVDKGYLFAPRNNLKHKLNNIDFSFLIRKTICSNNNEYSFVKILDSVHIFNNELNEVNSIKTDLIYEINDNNYLIKNKKYGLLNEEMQPVLPAEYDSIFCFHYKSHVIQMFGSQLHHVFVNNFIEDCRKEKSILTANSNIFFVIKNGKYGLCDSTGTFIYEPVYDKIYNYYQGYVLLCQNGKIGLADTKGNIITRLDYDSFGEISYDNDIFMRKYYLAFDLFETRYLKELSEIEKKTGNNNGTIKVKKNGKWGFVDFNGKQILPCEYAEISNLANGHCGVKKGKKWFVLDSASKEYIEVKCDNIEWIYDRYAVCLKNNKGFLFNINTQEKSLIFDSARVLITGQLLCGHKGKLYIINKNGSIPKESFDEVNDALKDRITVRKGDNIQLIDAVNNTIINENIEKIPLFVRYKNIICLLSKSKWIDKNANTIFKVNNDSLKMSSGLIDGTHGEFYINLDNKKLYGVIDIKGTILIPAIYDKISDNRMKDGFIECEREIYQLGGKSFTITDFYNNNYEKLFSY